MFVLAHKTFGLAQNTLGTVKGLDIWLMSWNFHHWGHAMVDVSI